MKTTTGAEGSGGCLNKYFLKCKITVLFIKFNLVTNAAKNGMSIKTAHSHRFVLYSVYTPLPA